MIDIENDIDIEKPLESRFSKTWHIPYDTGSFVGYVADFKTEVISAKSSIDGTIKKYSGIRLYINQNNKPKGGYSLFVPHDPYFYYIPKKGCENEVIEFIKKNIKLPDTDGVKDVKIYHRHVFGIGRDKFYNLRNVFQVLLYSPKDVTKYSKLLKSHSSVLDCRENTFTFTTHHNRCAIDLKIFCFKYYKFVAENGILIKYEPIENQAFPQLNIFTFDIEVRKKPVKKPQPDDHVNVIGVKYGERGYVFNNLEKTHFEIPSFWVGVDQQKKIRRFTEEEAQSGGWKYAPVFYEAINVENERELIKGFYDLIISLKPQGLDGYASDFFDWSHLDTRGKIYNILFTKIFDHDFHEGRGHPRSPDFFGDFRRDGVQMFDTMDWTERDSYVSKGMRGLKDISKELLGIEAIQIDHEEQVRIWMKMEDEWINPDFPENADPIKFEENKKRAFDETFNHAIYCASDVFVTDIFATQSSLGLNIAVATRIPMTFFEVSRKKRGPMVELDLINRMNGKMIAPNKVMKKSREHINPVKVKKESSSIYKEVKKKVNGEDIKYWAECLSLNQMNAHCSNCKDTSCKNNWEAVWALSSEKQRPILCDSESNDKEQKFYFPLENNDFFVAEEKYEGARVSCFSPGIFKDNADIDFVINQENFSQFGALLHEALDRLIIKAQSSPRNVKGYKDKVMIKILDSAADLHEKITQKFNEVLSHLELRDDGKYYWRGHPVIIHVDVASMYPNIIINFNLQPYAVTTEDECSKCEYCSKEDEIPCWVDMKWNAVYKVMNIGKADQEKAESYIQSEIDNGKEFEDDDLVDIYKRYSQGSKKFNTYKFPVVSRFCQKAFKFFVNTVKSFRDERYHYKYLMVDKDEEIDKLKSKYNENKSFKLLKEILDAVEESKKEFIESSCQKLISSKDTPEPILITLSEIIEAQENGEPVPSYVKKMMESLKEKYGEREIPVDVKIIIDELSIQKVSARNMQLGMKVLLNSFYGYLKSVGARFWSIEAAGSTCLKGQEVIDFAVNICSNFACSINIELDTDGLWTALPGAIPLEINYKYQVAGKDEIYTDKFNIFNENLNYLVKQKFTNKNNYIPVNNDGEYDEEIEYKKEWIGDRKWKQSNLCEIKFDYDGPFSTLFVYTKKRMKVYKRDKKNVNEQEIDVITGLDELRKGELGLIRRCSKEITDAYRDGDSIVNCYETACNIANSYIDQIKNRTLDLDLILESRDLSDKSAQKVNDCYKEYQEFLKKYKFDPMNFPVFATSIKNKLESRRQLYEIWKGEKDGRRVIKPGILPRIAKNPYTFAGFRTLDLGIPIESGDSVEWIITPYPRIKTKSNGNIKMLKEKKSQRAIPSKLFDSTQSEILLTLEKWFGEKVENVEMKDYVDWDFYLEKFTSMLERYLIIPARSQGINVYQWLHIKNKSKKKENPNLSLDEFIHPLSFMKKSKVIEDDEDDDIDDIDDFDDFDEEE